MTFRVKKWTFFCLFLLIGIALYVGALFLEKSRESFFQLKYSQNIPLFERKSLHLIQNSLPIDIIFRSSSLQATDISKTLKQKLLTSLSNFENFSLALDQINRKEMKIPLRISFDMYTFWSNLLSIISNASEERSTRSICSTAEISVVDCLGSFPKIFSAKEEEHQNKFIGKSWFLEKNTSQKVQNNYELNMFFELYLIKTVRDFLAQHSLKQFVLRTSHFVLSQDKFSHDGWAVYWQDKRNELYYLRNELLFFGPENNTPDTFIKENVPFDTDFSFVTFLSHLRDKDPS